MQCNAINEQSDYCRGYFCVSAGVFTTRQPFPRATSPYHSALEMWLVFLSLANPSVLCRYCNRDGVPANPAAPRPGIPHYPTHKTVHVFPSNHQEAVVNREPSFTCLGHHIRRCSLSSI